MFVWEKGNLFSKGFGGSICVFDYPDICSCHSSEHKMLQFEIELWNKWFAIGFIFRWKNKK